LAKSQKFKLDDRDLKILSILQREGRITKAALAKRVNLSPTPCWDRLKRLEVNGIIEGYSARISPSVFPAVTTFFMEVELTSHKAHDFEVFERKIQTYDDVTQCWALGGGLDYLLQVEVQDVNVYQRLVDQMLGANIGLKRYYTYIVTKIVKTSSEVNLCI